MTRDWIQAQLADALHERYDILRWIGGGGMAQVFLARNRVLGALFAVKVLNPNLAEDERIVARFLQEARTAVTLAGHPNIVPVVDVYAENGLYFFIMHYVEGEDLARYLNRKKKLSPDEATKIVLEAADALMWASTRGFVHRDIKPSNLYLNQSGHVMVLDFGIAKAVDDANPLTRMNEKWGTLEYMSPEQKRGDACDTRSDLYSLGLVFFELLTGKKPFKGSSETSTKKTRDAPPELRQLDPSIPANLSLIVAKLLAPDTRDRYQSPKELIDDLSKPQSNGPRPPPLPMIAVSTVLILIALASLIWYYFHRIPQTVTDRLGGRMLLVSAGKFTFGDDDRESPNKRQNISLPAFYIDTTEVSNRDYRKFCKEMGHKLPPSETFDDRPDFPVTNVSFEDAEEYAQWLGKRLPSEKEWEKAARGTDGRVFPWGSGIGTNAPRTVQTILSCPNRLSPYGAYNMAGNVAEWTTSHFPAGKVEIDDMTKVLGTDNFSHNWRAIKGGYFGRGPDVQRFWKTYMRRGFPENVNVSPVIGFRCVQSAKDP